MNEMAIEKEFEIACNDPSKRQNFLDNIDFGPLKKVKRLVYKNSNNKCKIMKIHNGLLRRFFGFRFNIFIYPMAFHRGIHKNVHDFLCTLYYHEGFHAIQIIENHEEVAIYYDPSLNYEPELISYYYQLIELKAKENQLKHLTEKNSSLYKKALSEDYTVLKAEVDKMKEELGLE